MWQCSVLQRQVNSKKLVVSKDIVQMLMVEEWNSSIVYGDYYNECAPIRMHVYEDEQK